MTLRIGCGSGGAPDRVAPALALAERGELDFLCFESLAERTLAMGHVAKRSGRAPGHCPKLEARMRAVLPACAAQGVRIVTNMGGADPRAAGETTARIARELGLRLRVAVIEGDDVLPLVGPETRLPETGERVGDFGPPVAANAYIGHEPLVEALDGGADVVIAGRAADPSLFLAPFVHANGVAPDDWARLGAGTLAGHLLECSTQVTGGYFADPGVKDVPGIEDLGYPIAEMSPDGSAVITKLPGTGGLVAPLTVKEQMLYEVHDPAAYLTPDVTADFSTTRIEAVGPDRVRVSGAGGRARPQTLKALVAFDGGYLAEGEISWAGPGAQARGELAREIVRRRMVERFGFDGPLRLELIGVASLHLDGGRAEQGSQDVRLRGALRSHDRAWAERLLEEIEGLWMAGPAGGGGFRGRITESVFTRAIHIDRALVPTRVNWIAP
ncbi:acyclic terpene utilization AtuA family protein [uncultured Albimonas sp.]|uniref:acyclic terpene utilization AtuA family protein n=1 Tax=uncultured Albimonas sp. TaxID=1331701 RepID=UPI0030EB1EB5|tara:strand:- start:11987 stop:13312 length:1326 start_codon:yes stop_codon:yes gene_type:complete